MAGPTRAPKIDPIRVKNKTVTFNSNQETKILFRFNFFIEDLLKKQQMDFEFEN